LTRGCLEVCRDFCNPVGIITKSAIVRRDIEVIAELARTARAHVYFSVAFSDDKMARLIEPGAPSPSTRLAAMKALADAGIPVGVSLAPIIPGLNDTQVAEILERAYECGARRAFRVMLRLPAEVKPVFLQRLEQAYPGRAQKVINAVREMRGGALYNSQFHTRGKGSGQRWDAIEWLFDLTCKKLGMNVTRERDLHPNPPQPTFQRPGEKTLFD
jgi:DNA repair photolyase